MTDLDARVAALPKRYEELQKSGIGTDTDPKSLIIKALQDKIAELQKPALHDPVTDAETDKALQMFNVVGGDNRTRIRRTLSYFLQGRAKPAQEEITDAESKKWLLRSAKAEALLRRVHRLMPIFEKGIGQLTFTAEAGGEIYAELRAIQLELSGHTEESWTEAAIRASKGEKK